MLDLGDDHTLTPAGVPEHLGDPVAAEVLRHNTNNDATCGIWRIRGTAGSAVLKVYNPPPHGDPSLYWPTSDDPAHWNYWRREELAYTSGLAATAFDGVTVPEVLASHHRDDGRVELWLGEESGAEGFAWTVPRLARFAYELGAGQARWAGRVPDTPWLSRDWLTSYLAEGPSRSVDPAPARWDDPRAAVWPAFVRERLRRLWAERGVALKAARAAERTLCHLDVWPANLIDADGRSVLLDWSFVGEGALGEDIANLVVDSFTDGLMDPGLLPELAEQAVDAYVAGLADGGWTGSPDAVRTAVKACGAAKYSWFAPAVLDRAVRDDVGTSNYARDTDPEALLRRVAGLVGLIADWWEDAS
ncbi:hypothetical protein AB0M28_03200 [Streptomyces sp. NPDC051940]|uniref:hypothetical protein n=1 Tax=Streptomyces sp. NPDC051940 TaxID=3155675 RepID=UPI0034374067